MDEHQRALKIIYENTLYSYEFVSFFLYDKIVKMFFTEHNKNCYFTSINEKRNLEYISRSIKLN